MSGGLSIDAAAIACARWPPPPACPVPDQVNTEASPESCSDGRHSARRGGRAGERRPGLLAAPRRCAGGGYSPMAPAEAARQPW